MEMVIAVSTPPGVVVKIKWVSPQVNPKMAIRGESSRGGMLGPALLGVLGEEMIR